MPKTGPNRKHANTEAAIDRVLAGAPVSEKQITFKRTNQHGLTDKQEAFARGVLKYPSLADAYRNAFDAGNMSVASIYSEASRLMDHPNVAARVRGLMEDRDRRKDGIDAKRIRQHVYDRLMVESVDDDSPPAARIRALELLGKIDVVAMFKEPKGDVPDTPEDVAGLQAKLEGMLRKLIDVTPSHGD